MAARKNLVMDPYSEALKVAPVKLDLDAEAAFGFGESWLPAEDPPPRVPFVGTLMILDQEPRDTGYLAKWPSWDGLGYLTPPFELMRFCADNEALIVGTVYEIGKFGSKVWIRGMADAGWASDWTDLTGWPGLCPLFDQLPGESDIDFPVICGAMLVPLGEEPWPEATLKIVPMQQPHELLAPETLRALEAARDSSTPGPRVIDGTAVETVPALPATPGADVPGQ